MLIKLSVKADNNLPHRSSTSTYDLSDGLHGTARTAVGAGWAVQAITPPLPQPPEGTGSSSKEGDEFPDAQHPLFVHSHIDKRKDSPLHAHSAQIYLLKSVGF